MLRKSSGGNKLNRNGTLNAQLKYWKGQKVYLDKVVLCVT